MLTQDRPTPTNSESLFGADQLLLKRSITVKAVVTPLWKDEAQQQLQSQVDQIDRQLEQLDQQVQQMIAELQRQSRQILSVSGTSAETQAEIENIQRQGGDRKSELLEQREQILQQINQVLLLELGQEAEQGQI
ncbi:MAG: hypothetical protein HC768_23175, partial [Acaryochloris sp. CRU_2_0]|nr:hypothetical protein [Acaryochloris sp. CRU_2_0]